MEEELCDVLRGRKIPSIDLITKIAVCKVRESKQGNKTKWFKQVQCVDTAILYCFRLKQEIGSYALMVGSGGEEDRQRKKERKN